MKKEMSNFTDLTKLKVVEVEFEMSCVNYGETRTFLSYDTRKDFCSCGGSFIFSDKK